MDLVFLHKFVHTVDGQRRVALPKEWRQAAPDPFVLYLLPGHTGTVHALPDDYFRSEIIEKVRKVSFANPQKSRALARMGAEAVRCVCDRQGRVTLSPTLMAHAGITDQALLVGGFITIQIMAPGSWTDDDANLDEALGHFQNIQEAGEI